MDKINKIITTDDYQLIVCFDNHHAVIIDMKKKLHTVRFSELRDQEAFKTAVTNGKLICWSGGLSLSVSEILEMGSKCTQVSLWE